MNMVWMMIFFSIHTNSVNGAIEFSSKETCLAAAVQMSEAVETASKGIFPNIRKPICIQVKK
jgi:hypothetical protein